MLVLAACTGPRSPAPAGAPATTRSPRQPRPAPAVPTGPPQVRAPLVLRADLNRPPAAWRRVAFVPFGRRPSELGLELPPVHTSLPLVPRSFTISSDGTLWILDTVKARVAHYSAHGAYLGQIGGLFFDRFHPHPRDLAFWGGRLVVLQELQLAASLREARSGGFGPPMPLEDGAGRALDLLYVYPSSGSGLGLSEGHASLGLLGTGPRGTGRVLTDGRAGFHALAGIPAGDGTWVAVTPDGEQSFRVDSAAGRDRVVQPVRIRMVAGPGGGHAIGAIVSEHLEGAGHEQAALFLRGSPAGAADQDAFGGGRWFLGYPTDGAPLVWERLPDAGLQDSYQVRHLAIGPSGRVYLMLATRTGMAFYER